MENLVLILRGYKEETGSLRAMNSVPPGAKGKSCRGQGCMEAIAEEPRWHGG